MKKANRIADVPVASHRLVRRLPAQILRSARGGTGVAAPAALPDLDSSVGHGFGLED